MKRLVLTITVFFLVFACLHLTEKSAAAGAKSRVRVTIKNLTRNQIFSPPIVISHKKDFQLFRLGSPASPQLYPLAEDGDTEPLQDYLATLSSVKDFAMASGPVLPGESVTLEVKTRGHFSFISAAGMLVSTNDAFFAVRGIRVPWFGKIIVDAEAYDAGSEANSESCTYIPGPPCGNGGVRDTAEAEGYVHIHAGIHGIADLDASMHDWRNPVAAITIRSSH